jgi:hypothetical protein
MKKFLSLILLLMLSNAFINPVFGDETQSPPIPIETEQDKRDKVVYPILRDQLQVKIKLAKEIASKSGTVTTLDQSAITEITDLLSRQISLWNLRITYYQSMTSKFSKCSTDLTLSTAELEKCRMAYESYRWNAAKALSNQRSGTTSREYYLSVQKQIDSEAAIYLMNSKKVTITCVKGKLTKKVTAVKPKCPTGYTIKK